MLIKQLLEYKCNYNGGRGSQENMLLWLRVYESNFSLEGQGRLLWRGNTAGDFRLSGREQEEEEGLASVWETVQAGT